MPPRKKWLPMKFFLSVIGMVMIIEGLPYFAVPAKMKTWLQQIQAVNNDTLRRMGLVLMAIGLALTYMGKSG